MSLFNKKDNKSKFVKEFKENENISILENYLSENKNKNLSKELEKLELINLSEKIINFELLNIYLEIQCFHKVSLEFQGVRVFVDYLILSSNFICCIKCLHMTEDFEINEIGVINLSNDTKINPFIDSNKNTNLLKNILTNNKLANDVPFISLVVTTNDNVKLISSKYNVNDSLVSSCDLTNTLSKLFNNYPVTLSVKDISKISEYILSNNIDDKEEYQLDNDPNLLVTTISTAKESLSNGFESFKKFTKKSTEKITDFTKENIEILLYTDERLRRELEEFENKYSISLPTEDIVKYKIIDDSFFEDNNLPHIKEELIEIIKRYI